MSGGRVCFIIIIYFGQENEKEEEKEKEKRGRVVGTKGYDMNIRVFKDRHAGRLFKRYLL